MTAIAVIGANGRAGSRIVDEALNRGFDVTAVVRGENRTRASKTIVKDLFELEPEDLAGFDAVVDAFGVFDPNKLSEHSTSLAHLADILSGSPVRLLVVGGAGSLYTDDTRTRTVLDTMPEGKMRQDPADMAKVYAMLRDSGLKYTFFSPACFSRHDACVTRIKNSTFT